MKVIPETRLSSWSVPDEGYSRNATFELERTWWRLFQKRVFRVGAYLMKVIPETHLSSWSVPDEGYSRNASFELECTLWRLFQKRVFRVGVYLMKVIPETRLSSWSVPDEERVFRVWACLMKVIPETRLSSWSVPDEVYSRNAPCTLNFISTFLLHLRIDFLYCSGMFWIYMFYCCSLFLYKRLRGM
jgi:hypothetical protein